MVRLIVLSVVLQHVFSAANTWGSEPTALVWYRDLTQASRVAHAQQRPLLLFLTSPDCTFCRRMVKETLAEPRINAHLHRRFVAVYLNGNAHPQLVGQLGVRMFPTTVIVQPSGEVLSIIHGFKAPPVFAQQLVQIRANRDRRVASAMVARQQR